MRKKLVAILVAVFTAATMTFSLTGCTKNKANEISILLLANNSETVFYTQYFKDMEAALREEGLDYTIKFTGQQEKDYYNTLGSLIQQGATPDIFYVRPNELLQYKDLITSLQSYADSQQDVDLTNIYDVALDMYRFNPDTGALGNKSDELYAFPKDLSTQQLGYNKTLLSTVAQAVKSETGLKMPWEMNFETENYSWAEYKKLCESIAKKLPANHYASDIPNVEILAKSFGSDNSATTSPLIDLSSGRANGKVGSLTDGPVQKAIKYQAELVASGAADYEGATYANMTAGRVCFYGLMGSWEVADYDDHLGADNWGVMPWPTEDGATDWQGLITSAGYVVSAQCASMDKGDVAKRIALSFMSNSTQEKMVRTAKISLPLRKNVKDDYLNAENDEIYSPKTRNVFIDVISGEHGFYPAKYSTFDAVWLDELTTQLSVMYNKGSGAVSFFNSPSGDGTYSWSALQNRMQQQYDATKNS